MGIFQWTVCALLCSNRAIDVDKIETERVHEAIVIAVGCRAARIIEQKVDQIVLLRYTYRAAFNRVLFFFFFCIYCCHGKAACLVNRSELRREKVRKTTETSFAGKIYIFILFSSLFHSANCTQLNAQ